MKIRRQTIIITLTLTTLSAALLWQLTPRTDLWRGVSFSRCYYDRDGKPLRVTLANDERYRVYTPLAVTSTLLHEDRWFNWHSGFRAGPR
ncbi:MAG: hypothetical protein LBD30_05000 [Verrucomicrobiales bacterium]|nr:hypothetical protein [Verrucomicrobiales bacterium]